MVMATYFQENLSERYAVAGAPNVGAFEHDVIEFLKATVTITQRAKRLKDLEDRWGAVAADDARPPRLSPASEEEAQPSEDEKDTPK